MCPCFLRFLRRAEDGFDAIFFAKAILCHRGTKSRGFGSFLLVLGLFFYHFLGFKEGRRRFGGPVGYFFTLLLRSTRAKYLCEPGRGEGPSLRPSLAANRVSDGQMSDEINADSHCCIYEGFQRRSSTKLHAP